MIREGVAISVHDISFLVPVRDAIANAGGLRGLAGASRECRSLAWELRDPSKRMLSIMRAGTRLSPAAAEATTSMIIHEGATLEESCPRCEELTLYELNTPGAKRARHNLPSLKKVTFVTRPVSYSRIVRQLESAFGGVEQSFVVTHSMRKMRPFRAPRFLKKK